MRPPRPDHRTRSRGRRWILWAVLAFLILAPVLGCQALSPSGSAPAASAVAVTAQCDSGLGHDALCSRGAVVTVGASSRGGRDGGVEEPGLLLTMTVVVALLGLAAATNRTAGPPPWAPQRLVTGRHQLLALGIARI